MSAPRRRTILILLLLWSCSAVAAEQDVRLVMSEGRVSLQNYSPFCPAVTYASPTEFSLSEQSAAAFTTGLRESLATDPFLAWSGVLRDVPEDEHAKVVMLAAQWGRANALSRQARAFLTDFLDRPAAKAMTDRQWINLQLELAATTATTGDQIVYHRVDKALRIVIRAFTRFKKLTETGQFISGDEKLATNLGNWLIFAGDHRKAATAYERAWVAYEQIGEDPAEVFSKPVVICNDVRATADLVRDYDQSRSELIVTFSATIDTKGEPRQIKVLKNPYPKLSDSGMVAVARYIDFRPVLINGKVTDYPGFTFSHEVYRGGNRR